MISYPSIPLPSTDLSDRSEPTTLRTDLQGGLVKQRPRFATNSRRLRVSWDMTREEFSIFQSWFINDLINGSLSFEIPWGYASSRSYRFAGGSYSALQTHWGNFSVTTELEVLEVHFANVTTIPPVAPWLRLVVNPVSDQQLTLSHQNARLVANTGSGSTTTLRVFDPTIGNGEWWIPFGIRQNGAGDVLITSVDADPPPIIPPASWPGTLPLPVSGFGEDSSEAAVRVEMDSGHTRQVRRFDLSARTYNVSWDLSSVQMQTFELFFYATLQNGSRPFTIALPVDGQFLPVPVRFSGGFSTRYNPVNRFRVMATLDRVLTQSVTPTGREPFGLYYSQIVNLYANRKVGAGDGNKYFFAHTSSPAQTISLHIGSLNIEFGVLLLGPGQLRITRDPFINVVDVSSDHASSSISRPIFDFGLALVDIGEIPGDNGESSIGDIAFELKSTLKQLGEIGNDNAESSVHQPSFDLKEVLVDVTIDIDLSKENASSSIQDIKFELGEP